MNNTNRIALGDRRAIQRDRDALKCIDELPELESLLSSIQEIPESYSDYDAYIDSDDMRLVGTRSIEAQSILESWKLRGFEPWQVKLLARDVTP